MTEEKIAILSGLGCDSCEKGSQQIKENQDGSKLWSCSKCDWKEFIPEERLKKVECHGGPMVCSHGTQLHYHYETSPNGEYHEHGKYGKHKRGVKHKEAIE